MDDAIPNTADRRDQILDRAALLIAERGYAHTSVQAIIDAVGIAKGTFYHHFDSKDGLLEAILARTFDEMIPLLDAVVDDPSLAAIPKFAKLFRDVNAWKVQRAEQFLDLFRALRHKANALAQIHMRELSMALITPPLARIIAQGVAEGCFDTPFPGPASRIVLEIMTHQSMALMDVLEGPDPTLAALIEVVDAHEDAVARVIGAPPGSLPTIDRDTLALWLQAAQRAS